MTYQTSLFPAPPDMPDIKPDMRVGFILSPRFTLLSFASFIDALRHAADEADFSRQIYCHWKDHRAHLNRSPQAVAWRFARRRRFRTQRIRLHRGCRRPVAMVS